MENNLTGLYIENTIFCVGLLVFAYWLFQTKVALKSLSNSIPRKNSIPLYLPFVFIFVWLLTSMLAAGIAAKIDGQETMTVYLIRLFVSLFFAIIGLVIARKHFDRGLKGLGINFRTIPKDIYKGFFTLLGAWPFIILGVRLVIEVGRLIYGDDFEFAKHPSLTTIAGDHDMLMKIVMIVLIAIVTPIFEEVLFRGLLQSTIRNYTDSPWISILLSGAIFTTLHPAQHWVGLFAMAICLGYAYEKSGSLLRSIFIHAVFNGVTTLMALCIAS